MSRVSALVQSVPGPVTITRLLLLFAPAPTVPSEDVTSAPLLITSRPNAPLLPT